MTTLSFILSSVIMPLNNRALAASSTWDINTAGEYTYDDTKIEFVDGVAQLKDCPFSATGGTMTTSQNYTIHTFTSDGTFTPNGSANVEVLVVAGGGSGGGSTAGGGGAGGLIYNSSYLVSESSMPVTIGDGGVQANEQTSGNNGENSVFGILTAIGGGGGGFTASASNGGPGLNGGSGGGGARYGAKVNINGLGTTGQGNNGGAYGTDTYPGGGGGGAGQAGFAPTASKSGNGGNGLSFSIGGSEAYYAGGGGGGSQSSGGNGGLGGGGTGTSNGTVGTAGTPNTGGGGGGGWLYSGGRGGAGGSGIVIIRYLTDTVTYPSNSPVVTSSSGQGYSSLSGFAEVLGEGSSDTIKYQISNDDGSTWYWWNGSAWITTVSDHAESSSALDINANIASFGEIASASKVFKWKAFLISDGSQHPKLDSISLLYVWDTGDPDNPVLWSAQSKKTDGDEIVSNVWLNHPSPYFTWNESSDTANDGETESGIAGYYIYFGTVATADPTSQRGIAIEEGGAGYHFQTDTNFEIGVDTSALVSGETYYLRIETKDNAGNIKQINPEDPSLFIYKYDSALPSNPALFSSVPTGWFREASDIPAFSWPISGGNRATDAGGSNLLGYQYRINSGAWYGLSHSGQEDSADIIPAATGSYTLDSEFDYSALITGENTFELRSWDNAGNSSNDVDSNRTIKALFYFNASAPTAVTELEVNPPINTVNSFNFYWEEPLSFNGTIDHYRYYVNNDNDPAQIYTTSVLEANNVRARKKGDNIFYIQAVDNAGNAGDIATKPFYADTSAPTTPRNVEMIDASSRDLGQYKISLNWLEPEEMGAGFVGYDIYRSNDNQTYSFLSTTTQPYFTDSNLDNTKSYYYQIKARDNANQSSPEAEAKKQGTQLTSIIPTGRFATAPEIVKQSDGSELNVQAKAFSVTVGWKLERRADEAFVECGPSVDKIGEAHGGLTAVRREKSDSYNIKLDGLQPSEPNQPSHYYCHAVWNDSGADDSEGMSKIFEFDTALRPTIDLPKADSITIDSARITWSSKNILNASVEYCPSNTAICPEPIRDYSGSEVEEHAIQLYNLTDGTQYFYRIVGTDSDGITVTSSRTDFTTLARPRISSVRFETVDAATTTVKIVWETNVRTTSIVEYSQSGSLSHKSDATYSLTHEIIIDNLLDRTGYTFTPKGVDEHGNQTINTEAQTFTTPNDTRPPKLRNLAVEIKSTGFGSAQKAQIIVTWETDEPATSQIEYGQGIEGKEYNFKTKEDSALTTSHAVIVSELEPSKIYHLRAVSRDNSGNPGYSEDTTTITGKSQSSVIDIIMNSLSRSLGWMFNIFD